MQLAWGAKVTASFRVGVIGLCRRLAIADPSWVMACIAFETGETFSADIRNKAGSGAVGLIQFMPATAAMLGTSIEQLSQMTPETQLHYVEAYFKSWAGRLLSLGDVYGAILWPGMISKSDSAVIFDKSSPDHPKLYLQNQGLDFNRDGKITKSEIVARVQRELQFGLTSKNAFSMSDAALSV